MKVIVVGGLASSLTNFRGPLLKELVRAGHDVVALAAESDEDVARQLGALGVRYRPTPMRRRSLNPLDDIRYIQRLLSVFREERPSVVLAYTIKPAIYTTLVASWIGVPVRAAMITGLGYAFGNASLSQRSVGVVATALYRSALARASVVFFQNPDDKDEFVRRGLVKPIRAEVLAGSGVDLEHYGPVEVPAEGPPVFLLVARLIREKGILDFVAAGRILAQRGVPLRMQVLGPADPGPGAIQQVQIDAWHREGIIEYLGQTEDVRPYLAACSVFVLPSYYREGTPRTSLEALATGRAIITTDWPGCREVVRDGVNGLLVPPRSPAALAAAIAKLARDGDLARRMGAASLELARAKYDVHLVNTAILTALGLDAGSGAARPNGVQSDPSE